MSPVRGLGVYLNQLMDIVCPCFPVLAQLPPIDVLTKNTTCDLSLHSLVRVAFSSGEKTSSLAYPDPCDRQRGTTLSSQLLI